MIIRDAKYITSGTKEIHFPEGDLPEILLSGRSNVGKSSFINSVLNRKNIAHVSGRPGKTQTLNFYRINDEFHFVDVPGYGYARVSKTARLTFGKMIEEYLLSRKQLKLVVLLVDFRHKPSKDDVLMYEYLAGYNIPCLVVGTKVDKVPKTQRAKHQKEILETLHMDEDMFLPYSSTTKENIEDFHDLLEQVLES